MEIMLAVNQMQAAVRTLNVGRFLEAMTTYPRAVVEGPTTMASVRAGNIPHLPAGKLKPIELKEWSDQSIQEATVGAVLVFALVAVCSGRADVFEALRIQVLQSELLKVLSRSCLPRSPSHPPSGTTSLMLSPIRLDLCCSRVSCSMPGKRSWRRSILSNWLIATPLAKQQSSRSSNISLKFGAIFFQTELFEMRSPGVNGPVILAAFNKGDTALARLANLVLATEASVSAHLPAGLRQTFQQISQPKAPPTALIC